MSLYFAFVVPTRVLVSLFKGAISQGFQVNSVLKSKLSTFTHTRNAPVELFIREY